MNTRARMKSTPNSAKGGLTNYVYYRQDRDGSHNMKDKDNNSISSNPKKNDNSKSLAKYNPPSGKFALGNQASRLIAHIRYGQSQRITANKLLYNNNSPEFEEVLEGFIDFIEEIKKIHREKGNKHGKLKLNIISNNNEQKSCKSIEEEPILKKKIKADKVAYSKEFDNHSSLQDISIQKEINLNKQALSVNSNSNYYEESSKDDSRSAAYEKKTDEVYNDKGKIGLSHIDDPKAIQKQQQYIQPITPAGRGTGEAIGSILQSTKITETLDQQKLKDQYNYLITSRNPHSMQNVGMLNLQIGNTNPNINNSSGGVNTNANISIGANTNIHPDYISLLPQIKYYPNHQYQDIQGLNPNSNISASGLSLNEYNQLLAYKNLQNTNYYENQILQAKLRELEYTTQRNPTQFNTTDINLLSQLQLNQYYDLYSKYLISSQLPNADMMNLHNTLELLAAKNPYGIPIINQGLGGANGLQQYLNDYMNENPLISNNPIIQNATLAQKLSMMQALQHASIQEHRNKKFPVKRSTYHVVIAHYIHKKKGEEEKSKGGEHEPIQKNDESNNNLEGYGPADAHDGTNSVGNGVSNNGLNNNASNNNNQNSNKGTKNQDYQANKPIKNEDDEIIMIIHDSNDNIKTLSKENIDLLEKINNKNQNYDYSHNKALSVDLDVNNANEKDNKSKKQGKNPLFKKNDNDNRDISQGKIKSEEDVDHPIPNAHRDDDSGKNNLDNQLRNSNSIANPIISGKYASSDQINSDNNTPERRSQREKNRMDSELGNTDAWEKILDSARTLKKNEESFLESSEQQKESQEEEEGLSKRWRKRFETEEFNDEIKSNNLMTDQGQNQSAIDEGNNKNRRDINPLEMIISQDKNETFEHDIQDFKNEDNYAKNKKEKIKNNINPSRN